MQAKTISRRALVRNGVAGLSIAAVARLSPTLFAADDEGRLVPFIDPQPIDPKRPILKWEDLREWITPEASFFHVQHYGQATVDLAKWKLKVEGLVGKPMELTLDQIKSRPATTFAATLECSGNGSTAGFMGAVGNARWTGTPLAPLLSECGIKPETVEIAFWGADHGAETIRTKKYDQNFARTLKLAEVKDAILAWDMNG